MIPDEAGIGGGEEAEEMGEFFHTVSARALEIADDFDPTFYFRQAGLSLFYYAN